MAFLQQVLVTNMVAKPGTCFYHQVTHFPFLYCEEAGSCQLKIRTPKAQHLPASSAGQNAGSLLPTKTREGKACQNMVCPTLSPPKEEGSENHRALSK